ncbi:transmembrane protein 106C-like [Polyodon spathula]|uniref:transmembrane protein 106C-like n=1 Tax=Polyodon spathula TaxID=7913 RepID=UPI001B7DC9D9|nr:transmembrane protein 106C-like [Polyodon spathula]XP_041095228.1 transmembrane protein 106C-like [Polyodon spathula]
MVHHPVMGSHLSHGGFRPLAESSRTEGDDDDGDSLDGRDRQDDIAQFPYVEFTGRDSITCPTCQGAGRIPTGQVNELVALIPYSDQRLQPQRTKLYVVISVVLCLLASALVAFFLFPRSVLVSDDGIKVVMVQFDRNNSKVFINMTSTLNVSNSNFYTVSVDSLTSQVLYMKTVIGTQQLSNVLQIQPLSQRQVNFTVAMEIGGSLSYVYTFCTMATIKVHNIVVFMQTSVKTSYMVRSAQNSLEAYRYIDCGSNSTVHRAAVL